MSCLQEKLEAMGADGSDTHLLDSAEAAEREYAAAEKDPAAFGWDSFNQATLYKAYEKRAAAIPYTKADWDAAKAADPEFYRSADTPAAAAAAAAAGVTEENVAIMRRELLERDKKRAEYSRRRKVDPDAAAQGINRRNDVYVKKLDRFYGEATREIRANLERGTALPDR
jgi:pre-mRNA-splicing factor SYF2